MNVFSNYSKTVSQGCSVLVLKSSDTAHLALAIQMVLKAFINWVRCVRLGLELNSAGWQITTTPAVSEVSLLVHQQGSVIALIFLLLCETVGTSLYHIKGVFLKFFCCVIVLLPRADQWTIGSPF